MPNGWFESMQNYLLSIFTSVGGIALVIVACQTIVFMEKANEERHYRETCAIHASDNEASAESTLKRLGIKEVDSVVRFCHHYK